MDIRQIALYLAGKLPPYYGESNLYRFSKKLKNFAPEQFTNNEMQFIQNQAKGVDEDVYFMILDDLHNELIVSVEGAKTMSDFYKLLEELWVPSVLYERGENNKKNNEQSSKKDEKNSSADKIYGAIIWWLDSDIKQYFFKWLQSLDYVAYLREMLIILSDYYNSLCKIKWLGDYWENDAVNRIFEKIPDLIVMQDVVLDTDDGKSEKEWMKSLLNGIFKKLRNVMMHNTQKNCALTDGDFVAYVMLINSALKDSKRYFPLPSAKKKHK